MAVLTRNGGHRGSFLLSCVSFFALVWIVEGLSKRCCLRGRYEGGRRHDRDDSSSSPPIATSNNNNNNAGGNYSILRNRERLGSGSCNNRVRIHSQHSQYSDNTNNNGNGNRGRIWSQSSASSDRFFDYDSQAGDDSFDLENGAADPFFGGYDDPPLSPTAHDHRYYHDDDDTHGVKSK